ncbi:MAG: carbohydrate ABC transporter permease, partial [Gammaproteobacteria bacterium]|nr:carbohydrate ABC transporter permease [Gammaproteobacteria bacterium]
MVSVSLMSPQEATELPPHLIPRAPTLAHYRTLWQRLELPRYLANSVLVAVATTGLSLVFNTLGGYAFAKLRFTGRDRLLQVLLATMVIPGQVGMLPLFLMLKQFGLINTYAGVILPGMASVFGIFMIRQYARSIPDSLLDAARIDGAGEWRIFRSVVLPLCRPILVTLALFSFLGAWNDFMWPLIVLSDDSRYTLPVALANLLGEHLQDTELMMAGAVVTTLPAVVIFLLLQRHYV